MTINQPTETSNDLAAARAGLARSATALMALTIGRLFPTAVSFTVDITENGGSLVAVYSSTTPLWLSAVDDDPTGDLAELDDLLFCARLHADLDHTALPGWTAVPVRGCMWDIEVSDVTTRPLGNDLV